MNKSAPQVLPHESSWCRFLGNYAPPQASERPVETYVSLAGAQPSNQAARSNRATAARLSNPERQAA